MYISHIKIKGFRNFKDSDIEFNDGLNVLIGHNNAGKTNLLKALQLVIEPHYRYRRLNANDFNRDISLENLKSQSPSVTISVTFKNSNIEYNEQEEDLRVVANWFTDIESGYAAMLTYRFYLPAEKKMIIKQLWQMWRISRMGGVFLRMIFSAIMYINCSRVHWMHLFNLKWTSWNGLTSNF